MQYNKCLKLATEIERNWVGMDKLQEWSKAVMVRPRTTWSNRIEKIMRSRGMSLVDMRQLARDRKA